MLRTIFVVAIFAVGWSFALQSPLYAACLYLWIAYFRPESWAWSDIFQSLNLSYIAGVYLIARTFLGRVPIRIDGRSALLIAFLLHSLMSTSVGLHSEYSFSYWWDFSKVIVIGVLLANIIRTPGDLRLVLIVITLSLGFEAGKQGWAQLILNPGAPNENGVPFLGDNNLVAVGMAMLLPVVGALAATSTGWWRRGCQFLSVGVLYRAVSTYSRGGFLSIGVVGATWFWRSPNKFRTLVAVLLAAALVLPVLPQQFWDRMGTITATEEQRDDSAASRLHFWQVAIAMANDRPWTGVGHRGYERAYNQYDWTHGQFLTNRAVHSAWFGVLGDLGYPGLLIFILIIFGSLLSCRRVRLAAKHGEVPEDLGRYAIAFETALVAFMVGGSFVSFHYCEMLWHFFALTIALERVAVAEAARIRVRAEQAQPATPQPEPVPDFVWA